jgi:hypothetical protein
MTGLEPVQRPIRCRGGLSSFQLDIVSSAPLLWHRHHIPAVRLVYSYQAERNGFIGLCTVVAPQTPTVGNDPTTKYRLAWIFNACNREKERASLGSLPPQRSPRPFDLSRSVHYADRPSSHPPMVVETTGMAESLSGPGLRCNVSSVQFGDKTQLDRCYAYEDDLVVAASEKRWNSG